MFKYILVFLLLSEVGSSNTRSCLNSAGGLLQTTLEDVTPELLAVTDLEFLATIQQLIKSDVSREKSQSSLPVEELTSQELARHHLIELTTPDFLLRAQVHGISQKIASQFLEEFQSSNEQGNSQRYSENKPIEIFHIYRKVLSGARMIGFVFQLNYTNGSKVTLYTDRSLRKVGRMYFKEATLQ